MFKKAPKSEGIIPVGEDSTRLFPPGYQFALGQIVYTVKKVVQKDHADMRVLLTSDGIVEYIEIATLKKDVKDPGFKVLYDPNAKKVDDDKNQDPKEKVLERIKKETSKGE